MERFVKRKKIEVLDCTEVSAFAACALGAKPADVLRASLAVEPEERDHYTPIVSAESGQGITPKRSRADATVATSAPATALKAAAPCEPSLARTSAPSALSEQRSSRSLRCDFLSAEQLAALTVSFDDIESKLAATMATHGAALVTGVAREEELQHLNCLFAADLGELSGEKVDPASWPLQKMKLLGTMERCQLRALPQGRFAWAARCLPRVRRVYEVLHGTALLVSSCDNPFFAPSKHGMTSTNKNLGHVDHNRHDARFVDNDGSPMGEWLVYQGVLYVWSSEGSRASTTVIWPGSHRETYDQIMADPKIEKRGRGGNHFTLLDGLSSDQAAAVQAGWHAHARRVPVPRGALLLWSSRTVHQGWRGGPRLAQPVCWEPIVRRSAAARERKLRMAALGIPSSHWASLGLPHSFVPSKGDDEGLVKPCLQPAPLVDGVTVKELRLKLQDADWMTPLSADLAALLEQVILPDFKAVL